MKKSKNKKTKIVLLILVLCITLGYAVLRTGLNINGIATIPSVSWDVYFANYQNSASTNITPTTEPSTPVGTKPTTVSYAVTLANPGDLYEFTIDVVNGGTIDANINLVSKLDDVEIDSEHLIPDYLTYAITDTSDVDIPENHRLNKNTTETIKVKLLFKEDVDPEDLPDEGDTLYLDIILTATQAEKEEPEEPGVFTKNEEPYWTNIGQTIPNEITTYQTPAEVVEAWKTSTSYDVNFFLKHVLNDSTNVIEKTYIGFVITDALKQQWKGNCSGDSSCEVPIDNLVNGTYYLRGGVNEDSLSEKPIYEANKNILKRAYNYASQPSVCAETESSFFCDVVSSFYVQVYSSGSVVADYSAYHCSIYDPSDSSAYGSSVCAFQ